MVSVFQFRIGESASVWYQSFGYIQSFWILLKKQFRHFIEQVEDNLDFWRLFQLEFWTNFLEEMEDDVIWENIKKKFLLFFCV